MKPIINAHCKLDRGDYLLNGNLLICDSFVEKVIGKKPRKILVRVYNGKTDNCVKIGFSRILRGSIFDCSGI